MPHINFTGKGYVFFDILDIAALFFGYGIDATVYFGKDFLYGTRTQSSFAKHVFFTGQRCHFHACHSCAFLASVVLLFHQ